MVRTFRWSIRDRVREVGSRAIGGLLDDDRRADRIGKAVRTLQVGRRAFEERAEQMIRTLGFASREDLERVTRKVGRLRKRMGKLLTRLEEEGAVARPGASGRAPR